MTVAPPRPATDAGPPSVTRHRVAVRGRWVDVWATPAGGASVSVAGSRLAERLAAHVLGVPPSSLRVAPLAPSGRPVVLGAGAAGDCGISISHLRRPSGEASIDCAGLVVAAACRNAHVGVDVVAPVDVSAASIACFLTKGLPAGEGDARHAVRLWAAKEAAYKAAALDEAFRPRRIVIEQMAADSFRWSVAGRYHAVHGAGVFFAEDGHVLAVAVADRIPILSHGASPRS